MINDKQKRIKLSIVFIIFISLLGNLAYLFYEKAYIDGGFDKQNNEIINSYNANSGVLLELKQQTICSNLESPLGNISNYYRLVFLVSFINIISILAVFLLIFFKKYKKIILSYRSLALLIFVEIISICTFIEAFVFEPDYYYAYCVKFL